MYQSPYRQYVRPLVAVVAVAAVGLIAYLVWASVTFRLVSTNPGIKNIATVSPYIKLAFSKPLDTSSVKVSGGPDLVDSFSINDATVTVLLKEPLSTSQQYTLKITGIRSTGGKQLADKTFTFTPKDIPDSELPKDQQQALQNIQQKYNKLIQNDPLVQLLPFTGGGNEFRIDYNVQYEHQTPVPVIVVTTPTPQGQTDALNWIRAVGVDPAKYTIKFSNGPV